MQVIQKRIESGEPPEEEQKQTEIKFYFWRKFNVSNSKKKKLYKMLEENNFKNLIVQTYCKGD